MTEEKDLLHAGVLGMRWGVRQSSGSSSGSSYQKKIEAKRVKKIADAWSKTKGKKVSTIKAYHVKRAVGLTILALSAAHFASRNPRVARGILSTAKTAGKVTGRATWAVGKVAMSVLMRNSRINKYGGFDPSNVVNSRMWDLPVGLLTGGG
jgi:hypothetical protein